MTGDLVKAMRACPQPIVAAMDGICAGAGAILAMASDLRLGTARSKVAFLFVRVGLSGADMGACAILPRIIGQGRASELLYTGRSMLGEEAERWGFYNRLASRTRCSPMRRRSRATLAARADASHAMTKRMLHEEWAMGVDEAIDAEAAGPGAAACRPRTSSAPTTRSSRRRTPCSRATDVRRPDRPHDAGRSSTTSTARLARRACATGPRASSRNLATRRRSSTPPAARSSGRLGDGGLAALRRARGVRRRARARSTCARSASIARRSPATGARRFRVRACRASARGPISLFGTGCTAPR